MSERRERKDEQRMDGGEEKLRKNDVYLKEERLLSLGQLMEYLLAF